MSTDVMPPPERPRNILVVTPWYRPQKGGVATAVTALSEALAEHGANVSVLLKKSGNRREIREVGSGPHRLHLYSLLLRAPADPVRPLKRLTAFLLQAPGTLRILRRFVREQQIDAINVHYPTSSDVYFAWLRLTTGIPLFVTVHGSDLRLRRRPLLHRVIVRGILRAADRIVLSTHAFLQQSLLPVYPAGARKVALIPMAIDWRDFTAPDSPPPLVPPSRFILCVAKLLPIKGIDVLLRAFAQLSQHHPDEHLLIVGDGPERNELHDLTRDLAVADRVTFAGALDRRHVVTLMKRCLFFVLPSHFESFGLVNLEALACRKAVVSTRAGGIPEVVQDGVSGLLAEPGDVAGLRDCMNRLIEDPEFRRRLGDDGYRSIAARGLTWDACAAIYLKLLDPA